MWEHRLKPISLVAVEEIPLSRSAIYKKMEAGTFPRPVQLMGRSWWVKDEVDAWFDPEDTVQLILERRDELQGGFTEAELRARASVSRPSPMESSRNLRAPVPPTLVERPFW